MTFLLLTKIRERIRKSWHMKIPLSLVVPIVVAALLPEVFRYIQGRRFVAPANPATGQPLGIQDLVREVKAELVGAEQEMRAKKEIALFQLQTFEMELKFVLRADSKTKGGVRTELITAESEIQNGSERVQKLTLHWNASDQVPLEGTDPANRSITNTIGITGPSPKAKKGAQ